MITADRAFAVENSGDATFTYSSVAIECQANISRENYLNIRCLVRNATDGTVAGEFWVQTDKAAVNAASPSATANFDQFHEAVQLVVVDYLEGLSPNSTVGFSIV